MPLFAPSRLTLLAATSNSRVAFNQPLMNTLGALVPSFILPLASALNWTYCRPLVTRTMQIPTLLLTDGNAITKVSTTFLHVSGSDAKAILSAWIRHWDCLV